MATSSGDQRKPEPASTSDWLLPFESESHLAEAGLELLRSCSLSYVEMSQACTTMPGWCVTFWKLDGRLSLLSLRLLLLWSWSHLSVTVVGLWQDVDSKVCAASSLISPVFCRSVQDKETQRFSFQYSILSSALSPRFWCRFNLGIDWQYNRWPKVCMKQLAVPLQFLRVAEATGSPQAVAQPRLFPWTSVGTTFKTTYFLSWCSYKDSDTFTLGMIAQLSVCVFPCDLCCRVDGVLKIHSQSRKASGGLAQDSLRWHSHKTPFSLQGFA